MVCKLCHRCSGLSNPTQVDGLSLLAASLRHWLSQGSQCPSVLVSTHFHSVIQQKLLPNSQLIEYLVGIGLIDLMHWTLSPHVNKCEMDSGQKSAYYTAIFEWQKLLWSMELKVQRSSLQAPFSPVQEVILHLHPECTRSTGPNAHRSE